METPITKELNERIEKHKDRQFKQATTAIRERKQIPGPAGWNPREIQYTFTEDGGLIAVHNKHEPMRYNPITEQWDIIELIEA